MKEKLHNLCSSTNINRQIKYRKERDHSEDRSVDGRVGSEWILGRLAEGFGVNASGSG
jgi:hypothetical protein